MKRKKILVGKKDLIKAKKQQLCNKINQCRTLNEIKGWEKTFSFHSITKVDQNWDYYFLLDLIEFKLIRMRDYFWTHDIVVNEKELGNICNKLINILNAGYKTDIILEKDLHTKVNTRNIHRFFKPKQIETMTKEKLEPYYLPSIREQKAKRLFWKYLEHKIESLWD